MSCAFKKFLKDWGVKHRLSSAAYPQSNGRAEVGVKTAKRIILDNTSPDGSLDNDKAARAFLQYRNTPIAEIGLSPAQLLLHRQLRDHIPAHPKHYRLHREWVISATEREKSLAKRNRMAEESYNRVSRELQPLDVRTSVRVQDGKRWDRTGRVVEVIPNRQYRIRMDGSGRVTLRNRRFLRPFEGEAPCQPPVSMTPSTVARPPSNYPPEEDAGLTSAGDYRQEASTAPTNEDQEVQPRTEAPNEEAPAMEEDPPAEEVEPVADLIPQRQMKQPKALRDIRDYNNAGTTEEGTRVKTSRLRSGR